MENFFAGGVGLMFFALYIAARAAEHPEKSSTALWVAGIMTVIGWAMAMGAYGLMAKGLTIKIVIVPKEQEEIEG